MTCRRLCGPWLVLLVFGVGALAPARAQLATNFYNVTAIQTRVLPNAVQITIRTDGTPLFGGDLSDFLQIDPDTGRSSPQPVTSFRLRLVRARAAIPAFVDIGRYPVDSAVVTLGTERFARPFFSADGQSQPEPRVDIRLRFFVPVTVRRFTVDREDTGGEDDANNGRSVRFGELLGPRDVEVTLGQDRRSIQITVISDRADAGRAGGIRRSPPEQQRHQLSVTPTTQPNRVRIAALHTPLADLLATVGAALGVSLVAQPDAADTDVSLLLPNASIADLLGALATGYGLTITPAAPAGYVVGRGEGGESLERISLKHLSPERARLLLPDVLLPLLRADTENNALLVAGPPALARRVRQDLARLDLPRPQIRVEASAYEFASQDDARVALQATVAPGRESAGLDSAVGTLSLRIADDQKRAFSAAVTALAARGRARLLARPFLVVASGETGTLFLGQSRYIVVLQERRGRQEAEALRLPVGYSLTIQPVTGGGDITLDFSPRISTVDAVEPQTGLPTLGIREIRSVVRVRPGDAVIVAGLDSDLFSDARSFLARRSNGSKTALVVFVTARIV